MPRPPPTERCSRERRDHLRPRQRAVERRAAGRMPIKSAIARALTLARRVLQALAPPRGRTDIGLAFRPPPKGPMTEFTARTISSLDHISAHVWDACANPPGLSESDACGERYNPFLSHAFLSALERSKSVGGRSGWTPAHILVEADGRLAACAPAYVKTNSTGEYVFDHSWAQAYENAGGRPLLPEVAGRRSLHARHRPPAARRARCAGGDAKCADRRPERPARGG